MQVILAAKSQVKIIPTLQRWKPRVALFHFRQCGGSERVARGRRACPAQITHSLSQAGHGRDCLICEHSGAGMARGGHICTLNAAGLPKWEGDRGRRFCCESRAGAAGSGELDRDVWCWGAYGQ